MTVEALAERRPVGRLLPRLLRRPLDTLTALLAGRDVVFLTLARKQLVALNHPVLVEQVFADPAARGRLSGLADSTALRLGGASLPGLEDEEHRRRRTLVEGLFADPHSWSGTVTAVAREAAERWTAGPVDALAEMETVCADAVGRVVFGDDFAREHAVLSEYHALSRDVVMRIVNPLSPLLWRAPLPLTRRFNRAQAAFNDAVAAMIERRRANGSADDLLGRLVHARTPEGVVLSGAEARDEAWTYYSQAAPAYALTWAWWLLGRHADVEERLQHEADAAPDCPNADHLPFTQAVVREAIRLYPPGWALVHPAPSAIDVGGAPVSPGMPMLVSPWVLHRDGRFWPEPNSFDPDRWLGGRAEAIRPGSFIGFGSGPRRCPARPLAELIVMLVLATVARRWRLSPTQSSVKLGYVPFLQPKGGLPVQLVERRAP